MPGQSSKINFYFWERSDTNPSGRYCTLCGEIIYEYQEMYNIKQNKIWDTKTAKMVAHFNQHHPEELTMAILSGETNVT